MEVQDLDFGEENNFFIFGLNISVLKNETLQTYHHVLCVLSRIQGKEYLLPVGIVLKVICCIFVFIISFHSLWA